MTFECVKKYGKRMEKWAGRITAIKSYGSHIELRIESRSSILVLIGQTTSGHFACMPDFGAGCYLADLKDIFWNTEKLTAFCCYLFHTRFHILEELMFKS